MLTRKDFLPVTLEDRDLFRAHYARYPQTHSDNTFTNMVCWNSYAHYEFARKKGAIILASTIEGETKFRPPIGPRDPALLKELIRLAIAEGDDTPLVLVDEETRAWIMTLYPDLELTPDRDYFEYVYRTDDLAGLTGKQYLTIRRQLSRFRRNCSPVVEEISPGTLGEVHDFLVEWCEWKDCDSVPFLGYEKDAVFFALDHYEELGLSGLIIRVVGKIGAITLYEELSPSTAVVHFEKGLPDCEGIYKAINAEAATALLGRFEFINRESDMGVEGLREAKTRYHPHHMVEVYCARKDDLKRCI
ncbi:hypothetical protein J2741_001055 [Methanolinea mesophila]|uniref:DUF2156 domain-containing protein n=1 Tax=Methanolinea mesophila TaxID=547055 RepID=UPI001AE8005E|nr:phosphatidylglycerol lysyltransferase domain-containing protein [Methanolinea mesophila]MBP1928508.1 hypothetical protein [Methanolinea mesophila]